MDELARQYGMGQDPNRIEIPHTVGASADQFVYAGSGQAPPPPGTHRMSDGRVMANEGQTGGTHAMDSMRVGTWDGILRVCTIVAAGKCPA